MIGAPLEGLDTPCLLVDFRRLQANINEVQSAVTAASKVLRPHVKAHKIAQIAEMQLQAGATGITTAKLSEAEAFVDRGATDVLICYPVVGGKKIQRLLELTLKARITTIVDSLEGAREISKTFSHAGMKQEVLVKVDAGFGRVGASPAVVPQLVDEMAKLDGLLFGGLCIHEGSTYGVIDPDDREALAIRQCTTMVDLADGLRGKGVDVPVVSAGSTPGLAGDLKVSGITEVRPGNYVFYDAIQVGLGVAALDQCALSVLTSVVSTKREGGFIVDAGSKVFGLDKGAHGLAVAEGHGACVSHHGVVLTGLSEEHGWGSASPWLPQPHVGDILRFVPNHACSTINMLDEVWVVDGDVVIDRWQVCARGAVL